MLEVLAQMISLAPLFNTQGGRFTPLIMIWPAFMIVAGIWIYNDANERIGNGWLWGTIAFACPPIGIPLYYGMLLLYHTRGASPEIRFERERRAEMEELRRSISSQGDIERERLLTQAQEKGGTMYNPLTTHGAIGQGHKHFTDWRVEELIGALKHAEAVEYLKGLYATAREAGDPLALDTYTYYLWRIPGGRAVLEG